MSERPRRSICSSDSEPPSIRRMAWCSNTFRNSSTSVKTSRANPLSASSGVIPIWSGSARATARNSVSKASTLPSLTSARGTGMPPTGSSPPLFMCGGAKGVRCPGSRHHHFHTVVPLHRTANHLAVPSDERARHQVCCFQRARPGCDRCPHDLTNDARFLDRPGDGSPQEFGLIGNSFAHLLSVAHPAQIGAPRLTGRGSRNGRLPGEQNANRHLDAAVHALEGLEQRLAPLAKQRFG